MDSYHVFVKRRDEQDRGFYWHYIVLSALSHDNAAEEALRDHNRRWRANDWCKATAADVHVVHIDTDVVLVGYWQEEGQDGRPAG